LPPLLEATDFAAPLFETHGEQSCLFHERLYHALLLAGSVWTGSEIAAPLKTPRKGEVLALISGFRR
jgi:hypothetical protein